MKHTNIFEIVSLIGYNDRLPKDLLPCIVQPIFASKIGKRSYIIPSKIVEDQIYGDIVDYQKFQRMIAEQKVTVFDREFFAYPDYQLWINVDESPKYEPINEANKHLKKLHIDYLRAGENLISNNKLKEARVSFLRAFSINNRSLEALSGLKAIDFYLEYGCDLDRLRKSINLFTNRNEKQTKEIMDLVLIRTEKIKTL